MKLNVILRTCDVKSLQSDRIVVKAECVTTCLNSLVKSLRASKLDYKIHIIDDMSSHQTKTAISNICPEASVEYLMERDEEGLNVKQKSRYSVQVAYEYIHKLPDNELVYIVEDDYLHYEDSISKMVEAWNYFSEFLRGIGTEHVGIFPQDLNRLCLYPQNQFFQTYVQPCIMLAGPDRYYRTTWYTHESFMCSTSLIKKYKDIFDSLLTIGSVDGQWEGSTITNVWNKPEVKMLMPLGTLAVHMGNAEDISFYCNDWKELWDKNFIKGE